MSRYLFTCWPFEGHVHPQVGIMSALRERGHDVAMWTGPPAHPVVAAQGFEVFGFEHVDRRLYDRVHAAEERTGGPRQSLRVHRQALQDWLVESIPGQLADLRPLCERWRPDVVVTDLAMWGPIYVLGEERGLPVALSSTFLGPLMPGPGAPPFGFGLPSPKGSAGRVLADAVVAATAVAGRPLRNRVDAIRAEAGLPPMGCSLSEFPARLPLYLVANLPALDYGRTSVPPNVRYVGACTWHPPEEPGTAAWLGAVPTGRPWVHVTEGTSHFQDPFVLRAAARGLAGGDHEVILTTGARRDPAELDLGPPAANVHTTRWLSHATLIPRCDCVVTTGGPATIMAAARAGVPLVVVPTTWDKPDNARRVAEAGTGVRLPTRRCTPEGLRAAVEQVLQDPGYRRRAGELAAALGAAPGPDGAAHHLEALAPIPIRGEPV